MRIQNRWIIGTVVIVTIVTATVFLRAGRAVEYEDEVRTAPEKPAEREAPVKTAEKKAPEREAPVRTRETPPPAESAEPLRPAAPPPAAENPEPTPEAPVNTAAAAEAAATAGIPMSTGEESAVKQAEAAIAETPAREEVAAPVEFPEKEQIKTRLDSCEARFPGVNWSGAEDADGDGLGNRTECYVNTDPSIKDTDRDGCSDGDEINRWGTNPLQPDDCGPTNAPAAMLSITNPLPGWTVQSAEAGGVVPQETVSVTLVASPAENPVIRALSEELSALEATETFEDIKKTIAALDGGAVAEAKAFLANYAQEDRYAELKSVVLKLDTQVKAATAGAGAMSLTALMEARDGIARTAVPLQTLTGGNVVLGTANELKETEVNGAPAKYFAFAGGKLPGGRAYDLVALATLNNGTTVASVPIRFSVEDAAGVQAPQPKAIGDVTISGEPAALKNIWIGSAKAENGVELEIQDSRPTVYGDTEFGTQVFAVWESLVLASSVIADSEIGSFAISAPRELENDIGHKVTLYAVKNKPEGGQARSESVSVFFRVKPAAAFPAKMAAGLAAALIALTGGIFGLFRLKQK